MFVRVIIVVCIGMLLMGGSTLNKPELVLEDNDPVIQKLIESADAIRAYSKNLADIEAARFYEATGKTVSDADLSFLPGLTNVVSLGSTWNGPLESFLVKTSTMANMNPPRYLNVQPSAGIMVSVNTDYRPIFDMISDASAQSSSRARITLKVKERLFEVEYLSL
jgi:hypothetical protein